jgi:hypothetical protein|tara:strand:+ start:16787 stop:17125 length:339 start_codon:yes stop_codon:yes gene_type:complete
MEGFWKEAVKVTGSVAVVGFILVFAIKSIFQESVLGTFGSNQTFYLSMFVLGILAAALILALIINGKSTPIPKNTEKESSKENRTVSIDRSKVTGDIVLGDKTINQDSKRDK